MSRNAYIEATGTLIDSFRLPVILLHRKKCLFNWRIVDLNVE